MTTITSRDFNQDIAGAKRAARKGPVLITDRGKPAYVLMRHDTYRKLLGKQPSLADLLAHPASNDIEFDPPKLGDEVAQPAEFS